MCISPKQCVIFHWVYWELTLHIDLAVRDGPALSALQQVIHPSPRRTQRDLAHLFFFEMDNINVKWVVWADDATRKKPGSRSGAYPLVDCAVLAAMELLEVEFPLGHAGVDVVVIEDAVNRDVLPRPRHHFLRNVAHGCGWNKRPSVRQTRDSFSFKKCSVCVFNNKKKTCSRIWKALFSSFGPKWAEREG